MIRQCYRTTNIVDDFYNEDKEYAYQTAVNIGSHVFKGILYDQGSSDEHRYSSTPAAISAESSQHHLNLLASATSVATTTAVTARNNNTPSVDLSLVYSAAATPINSFITAEMANRVEASTCMWRRRAHSRHLTSLYRSTGARPSWEDDSGRDDESESNTFDWSDKRSSSQLKSSQERERESIIPKG
ncbi:hypothetical protein Rs2_38235 [Raphanus sativus]|nr:hypothetical protein Rs2_38235 [Raphanus sativus]